jgi:hypothetical protein
VPAIKFWVDGLETVDERDERPLGDAEKAELERQRHVSNWLKLVERAAVAAATLSAVIGFFAGSGVPRHRCDWAAVACGGIALVARFVTSRRP